ncbi:unnamed protein product [Discosporangium mesarthrocarpum]
MHRSPHISRVYSVLVDDYCVFNAFCRVDAVAQGGVAYVLLYPNPDPCSLDSCEPCLACTVCLTQQPHLGILILKRNAGQLVKKQIKFCQEWWVAVQQVLGLGLQVMYMYNYIPSRAQPVLSFHKGWGQGCAGM